MTDDLMLEDTCDDDADDVLSDDDDELLIGTDALLEWERKKVFTMKRQRRNVQDD